MTNRGPCSKYGQIHWYSPWGEEVLHRWYSGYLDVVFPGRYINCIHNKKDTYTGEGVNADLPYYIPTLARRNRCFPRKLLFSKCLLGHTTVLEKWRPASVLFALTLLLPFSLPISFKVPLDTPLVMTIIVPPCYWVVEQAEIIENNVLADWTYGTKEIQGDIAEQGIKLYSSSTTQCFQATGL